MTQAKGLITLGGSIPPQEVFLRDGSFVAHRGVDEYYEYSYLIQEEAVITLPLANTSPIVLDSLVWDVQNSGFTLEVDIGGLWFDLYDTTTAKGLDTLKHFVLPEDAQIKITNKSTNSNLKVVIQGKRSSLIRQPLISL